MHSPSCHGRKLWALLAVALPFKGAWLGAPGASGVLPSPGGADGQSGHTQPCSVPQGHPLQMPPGLKEKPEMMPKEESDIISPPEISATAVGVHAQAREKKLLQGWELPGKDL